MSIDLIIPVPNVDEVIGTAAGKYDSFRLYSAPERKGPYTLDTTVALVAGDTSYAYSDVDGMLTTWYKVTFYNSVLLTETSQLRADPWPAGRNLVTRKTLRQRIIRNLGGKILTPTSITTSGIVVSALIDEAGDSESYKGWHVYRPDASEDADNDRRVSAYDPVTGTLTHAGDDYTDITSASEQIEICPIDVDYDFLNEKIGDALEETRWQYRYEFGATSGTNQYNLPHFVESEEYVKEIWRREGTTPAYIWRPFDFLGGFAKVRGSNFQCVLDIEPSLGDNEVIALEVYRPGERLEAEDDFTQVTFKWAEAAAMCELLNFIITQDIARNQETAWGKVVPIWKEAVRKQSRKKGATPGMKVTVPQPFTSSFPMV